MNIFKVAYEPNIGVVTKSYIQNNITASMISNDGNSKQYELSFTIKQIEENKVEIPKADLETLKHLCFDDGVSFIEF